MRSMDWTQISLASIITFLVTWLVRPYFGSYLNKKGENRAIHEDLDKINRQLETIKSEFVGANAYSAEKAKGLATKEDIGDITRKVEDVRSEVSGRLELLKWELSKRATIHRLAAEKEFAALGEIGKALYELQLTTTGLRPSFDQFDPNEPEQERHNRRYKKWAESFDAFLDVIERYKLFMPHSLYMQFFNIRRLSHAEALDFEFSLKAGDGKLSFESYQRSKEKIDEMDTAIFEAIKRIRHRYGIED
jgi:hypothetical protein